MEGRGLAEDNAGPAKQVIRTQSRADLHNALERIRQAPDERLRVMIQGKSPVR
jgi:hypothetical protein